MAKAMTDAQKRSLYRDGFVVLPKMAPPESVSAARRRLFMALGAGVAPDGSAAVFTDLFNETDLAPLVAEALGAVPAARFCQLASRFPAEPADSINESGYFDRETPFHGWHGHLDGLWNGATPMHQRTDVPMTAAEREAWHAEPSRNGCRKTFPELGANIMGFAVLVAVALSDQTRDGVGNVGVLRGAHHEMEAFFRRQRDAGGPLGPDGPDWERIDVDAPNGAGLRHYPEAVRRAFAPDGTTTEDGRFWPRPTLLRLAPGDAALILHATPHSATRVDGAEPRFMAYFRMSPLARPEANRHVFPQALCDIWSEWPGMAEVVAAERAGAAAQAGPARER